MVVELHQVIILFKSVDSAILAAKTNSGKDDLIFIGGSTFVVADAMISLKTKRHL